ncbi:MAG: hypothetical protein D3903_11215 [Candidatus Electrothrix sp. GM3_4]|nr:hypothetical protein [Candidatus Electrothrix sp. GM3_4]
MQGISLHQVARRSDGAFRRFLLALPLRITRCRFKANKTHLVISCIKKKKYFLYCTLVFYLAIHLDGKYNIQNILFGNSQHFLFHHRFTR